MHATHDGGGQAAKKRARVETPQEATQHTGSDLTHVPVSCVQEAGLRCVGPRRPQAAYPEMHFSAVLPDSSIDRTTIPSIRQGLRRLLAGAGNEDLCGGAVCAEVVQVRIPAWERAQS